MRRVRKADLLGRQCKPTADESRDAENSKRYMLALRLRNERERKLIIEEKTLRHERHSEKEARLGPSPSNQREQKQRTSKQQ
jgi:hypothetical protein